MTFRQALNYATSILTLNEFEDNYFEAQIMLCHVIKQTREQLFSNFDSNLSKHQIKHFNKLLLRRLFHEPIPYITGNKEFFGNNFLVDRNVLIPRPETEIIVEEAIKFITLKRSLVNNKQVINIADIGTGCGAIAISIALHQADIKMFAVDISANALKVTKRNCEYHRVSNQITLLKGNLLEPLPDYIDLIVANLPYIKKADFVSLSPDILFYEPKIALDGGENGLNIIGKLLKSAKYKLVKSGSILLEIGAGQINDVIQIIKAFLPNSDITFIRDFNGVERVIKIGI